MFKIGDRKSIYRKSAMTEEDKKVKIEESSREASVEVNGKGDPVHEYAGGSSIRQYLNKTLTVHLLEGLKEVGEKKPEDPLQYLGEFLIKRGQELKE